MVVRCSSFFQCVGVHPILHSGNILLDVLHAQVDLFNTSCLATYSYNSGCSEIKLTMDSSDTLPIRDYGNFDPLKETANYINPCLCGCKITRENIEYGFPKPAQLGLAEDSVINIKRFFIRCPGCESLGPATKMAMYAALQWNLSTLCIKPSYKELPLFGISGLSKLEAATKVQLIRADLKKRLDECTIRLQDPDKSKHPGPRYNAKLAAYYAWSFYAMHLISDNPVFKGNLQGVKGTQQPQSA